MVRSLPFVILAAFLPCLSPCQALHETTPITNGDSRITAYLTLPGSPERLAVFFGNGDLVIYGANRAVVGGDRNVRRFATVSRERLYYESVHGFASLDLLSLKRETLPLSGKDYESFRCYETDGTTLLFGLSSAGIDVFDLPQCRQVAQIRTDPEWMRHILLCSGKMVILAPRPNALAGYDLKRQKFIWEVETGTKSSKIMGISFKSMKNAVTAVALDDGEKVVYAGTAFGDLYNIDLATGRVLNRVEHFRGDANNAGLLVSTELQDVDRDGHNEIVAGSVDKNIYCLNAVDFGVKWQHDADNEVQMPLRFKDVTGDGVPDVFALSDYDLKLMVLDGTSGRSLAECNLKTDSSVKQCAIAVADLDGSGLPYVFVRMGPERLRVFQYQR